VNGLVTLAISTPQTDAAQPWLHLIEEPSPLAFVVHRSQLFQISGEMYHLLAAGDAAASAELRATSGSAGSSECVPRGPLAEPVSISLNVAQACNLACTYCYADEGRFGGKPRLMGWEVARAAIDRLLDGAGRRRVTVGFIGGEPFLNRAVIYKSVQHASERARGLGVPVGFSITTNGTLLNSADIDLLREHAFAISVSLDGGREVNDRYRPSKNRAGSHDDALRALRPLLENPGPARVAARVTIVRDDLRVAERIRALRSEGFQEIGLSPMRAGADASATDKFALRESDWPVFLAEMIRAADLEWEEVRHGGPFRFSNLAIALKELHRGSSRSLPCGSAAGYVSINADGHYFTCHRTIDDPRFALGTVSQGLLEGARERFLVERDVDRQTPCRSCWARYLCGGGCHAEVLRAGRSGCDYIRGWLEHCLRLYPSVRARRPDLLESSVISNGRRDHRE
jgi:uncharacterized protein